MSVEKQDPLLKHLKDHNNIREREPFRYVETVLLYANFDLSFQRIIREGRNVPLTEEEKEYFNLLCSHIVNAIDVVHEIKRNYKPKKNYYKKIKRYALNFYYWITSSRKRP